MKGGKQRPENRAPAIAAVTGAEEAAVLMFRGLMLHYAECIMSGRLEVWAKAAHLIIDLCAELHKPDFVRRADLPPG
jgi:hypothetical protein